MNRLKPHFETVREWIRNYRPKKNHFIAAQGAIMFAFIAGLGLFAYSCSSRPDEVVIQNPAPPDTLPPLQDELAYAPSESIPRPTPKRRPPPDISPIVSNRTVAPPADTLPRAPAVNDASVPSLPSGPARQLAIPQGAELHLYFHGLPNQLHTLTVHIGREPEADADDCLSQTDLSDEQPSKIGGRP